MNDRTNDPSQWGKQAVRLAVHHDAWNPDVHAEALEGLLVAVTCALLDVADAVRGLATQPDALARLADAAPTAEALALLLRVQEQAPATKEGR